jgi:hypothetical protein
MNNTEQVSIATHAPGASPTAGCLTDDADPIFSVLAEHRAAMKAYLAASAVSGALVDGTPEWETADKLTQATIKREHAAVYAVLTGQPTTVAGVIALLEHVGQNQFLGEAPEGKDAFDETVLSIWMRADGSRFKKAAQALPRRLAATMRTLNRSDRIGLVDELYDEILAARGIEAAIWAWGLTLRIKRCARGSWAYTGPTSSASKRSSIVSTRHRRCRSRRRRLTRIEPCPAPSPNG